MKWIFMASNGTWKSSSICRTANMGSKAVVFQKNLEKSSENIFSDSWAVRKWPNLLFFVRWRSLSSVNFFLFFLHDTFKMQLPRWVYIRLFSCKIIQHKAYHTIIAAKAVYHWNILKLWKLYFFKSTE